jgi:hypothetical protein
MQSAYKRAYIVGSTTDQVPDIPRVGTGAVWTCGGGACAVLVSFFPFSTRSVVEPILSSIRIRSRLFAVIGNHLLNVLPAL